MCNNSCKECSKKVYSSSVTLGTVDTVSTLLIDIPAQSFRNCQRGCLVITQTIPETTTISTPVAITIGGVTTTVYPMVNCKGVQVTAPMLRTRIRYPFKVFTNATGAVFKVLKNLSCAPNNNLTAIPVATATPTGADTI